MGLHEKMETELIALWMFGFQALAQFTNDKTVPDFLCPHCHTKTSFFLIIVKMRKVMGDKESAAQHKRPDKT